jgi:purine-nucleoside phosphorylase
VKLLVQTNAAGSLRRGHAPGELMLLSDHLNLSQRSPLFGEVGTTSASSTCRRLRPGAARAGTLAAAAAAGIRCTKASTPGSWARSSRRRPRSACCRLLGAQAVGMSTVPETILARHAGMRVLALSLLTNMAAGMDTQSLSHAHTLATAKAGEAGALALLKAVLAGIRL